MISTHERRKNIRAVSSKKRGATREERRQHTREEFNISVSLNLNGKEISGATGNISLEGLKITITTDLSVGTPMTLKFSFGVNFCYMNIPGQVIYCIHSNNGKSGYEVGIKFSAFRDVEHKILHSVIEELRQSQVLHEKSLLSILVSEDVLAQEAAELETASTTLPVQPPAFERRYAPRIESNISVKLIPDNITGQIVDISETGFCFVSERVVSSKNVILQVEQGASQLLPKEIPAEIFLNRAKTGGQFYFGGRFPELSKTQNTDIRNFIFDSYAKLAASVIKNDVVLNAKVEFFFNEDVKKYHGELSNLASESNGQKLLSKDEIAERVRVLTNELLLKGDALEKAISNKMYTKHIKKVFRGLTSCWVYKSSISKMGYDKPRGYPGDYRIFEIIYNNKPLSEDNFGFYFDKYFLSNAYTESVRSRKDKMKSILSDFIESNSSSCTRLLNIACGPCKEIRELFSEPFVYGKKIIFTGLDHDERALELSKASLNYLPPNIQVRFLNESVLNIFKDERYSSILGKQDIICILGLAEYLPDRIFKKLINFLFQLLNSKGKLVIAFKDKNILLPTLPPDWFCDWSFIKRSEDDLLNIAKGLQLEGHFFKIERVGIADCIMFLTLTKPH